MQRPLLSLLALLASSGLAAAQDAVGVLVDRGDFTTGSPRVHVFDPVQGTITSTVNLPLPPFTFVFDAVITPDLSTAFVGSNGPIPEIFVLDLTTTPPSLEPSIQPTEAPLDMALTADGKWLVTATGNGLAEGGSNLTVVDVATRTQTDTVPFDPFSPSAIETAPDGSVLVAELTTSTQTSSTTNIRRFTIDSAGQLVDTGDFLDGATVPGVHNLLVPNYPFLPTFFDKLVSRHTVYTSRPAGGEFGSLRTQGLTQRDTEALGFPTGIDLAFDPLRSLLYSRSNERPVSGGASPEGLGRLEAFWFNPINGNIGSKVLSIDFDGQAGTAFGAEQIALDPVARRIYVSGRGLNEALIFDSVTGAALGTLSSPEYVFGVGITIRRRGL